MSTDWIENVNNVFLVTSQVKRLYRQHSRQKSARVPISTNGLLQVVYAVSGWDIKIFEIDPEVNWSPKKFKGMLQKDTDQKKAVLLIPQLRDDEKGIVGVSRCERRFAVLKEICHLLIDDPGEKISSLSHLVQRITSSAQMLIPVGEDDPILRQEYFAELAAVELLFWSEHRDDRFKRVTSGELTELDIATEFLVPECKIANIRQYHEFIERFREQHLDCMDESMVALGDVNACISCPEFEPTGDW